MAKRKTKEPKKTKTSWWFDHRRALIESAKAAGVPPPTYVELYRMVQQANQLVAHRADTGHYPDRSDVAQRCYLCEKTLTPEETETARQSVAATALFDPPPAPGAGSLEALLTELEELTHRLGVVTKKIAAAVSAIT